MPHFQVRSPLSHFQVPAFTTTDAGFPGDVARKGQSGKSGGAPDSLRSSRRCNQISPLCWTGPAQGCWYATAAPRRRDPAGLRFLTAVNFKRFYTFQGNTKHITYKLLRKVTSPKDWKPPGSYTLHLLANLLEHPHSSKLSCPLTLCAPFFLGLNKTVDASFPFYYTQGPGTHESQRVPATPA